MHQNVLGLGPALVAVGPGVVPRAPLVVGEQAVVPANLVDDVDPSALVAQHFAQYEPEREAVGRQQLEVGGALGTLVAPQDVLGDGKAVVSCKASAGQAAIHPVRPAEHTRRVRHDAVNKKVSLQPCVCVQHWFEFAAAKTKCRNLQPLSTLNPATTVDGVTTVDACNSLADRIQFGHMSTRATTRKDEEMSAVWAQIMALPENEWRGMIVKQRMAERARHTAMEERRSRRDLPRLLKAEKKLEALEALASSQAAQIADLQAMLGNALAALATPQVALPPIQNPESVELGELLAHFGL